VASASNTDGSPPVRIGEGTGEAISPDNKWVITKPAKGGALSVVPTGAGEARLIVWRMVVLSQDKALAEDTEDKGAVVSG